MHSVKQITYKIINKLHLYFCLISLGLCLAVSGQDNAPYSRFGIGDLVPSTHVNTRGMGGISAGFTDFLSVNFNNPASYAAFEAGKEVRSKKLASGRTILDVGINVDNRKLIQPAPRQSFTASNALFSYVQVGVPLRRGWGLSFGIRPVSRISYKLERYEKLKDPITGQPIDSTVTRFQGDGGSYLATIGTGLNLFRKERKNGFEESLSFGVNAGYFFGKKDYSSRRTFINDTVEYAQANYETRTNYGNIYFNAGLQYRLPLAGNLLFTAGLFGNLGQNLNATQDRVRETFLYDAGAGYLRLDSVSDSRNNKGTVRLPASYTVGFVIQKLPLTNKEGAWLLGVDLMQQRWDDYRFYGQTDSVGNKWELRIGGQVNPPPGENFFRRLAYRLGFFTGPDYIQLRPKLPQYGVTMGVAVPIANYNRLSPNQASVLNLSFEYIRRGNNDNRLRENLFRFSAGFSLSDIWFIKRKYD